MFTAIFGKSPPKEPEHREGELYRVITAFGKTFEIYYGYYEESDRYSKYPQPVEVFPNFVKEPLYTEDGIPFVTAIQDTCEHYKKVRDTADKCADCLYFEKGEELFGLCRCRERRREPKKENGI